MVLVQKYYHKRKVGRKEASYKSGELDVKTCSLKITGIGLGWTCCNRLVPGDMILTSSDIDDEQHHLKHTLVEVT